MRYYLMVCDTTVYRTEPMEVLRPVSESRNLAMGLKHVNKARDTSMASTSQTSSIYRKYISL